MCSHIANGCKHFIADPRLHHSVKDTKAEASAFNAMYSKLMPFG